MELQLNSDVGISVFNKGGEFMKFIKKYFDLGLSDQNIKNFLKHLAVVAFTAAALAVAKELGLKLDDSTIATFAISSPAVKLLSEYLLKA